MFHIDTVRLKETQDPDTNFSILTGDKFFPGLHVANTFQLYFVDVIKGLVRLFFFFLSLYAMNIHIVISLQSIHRHCHEQ